MSEIGHNSIAVDELKTLVGRVERLMEERKGINDDIRDVVAEAKVKGYDGRTLRKMAALSLKGDVAAERERRMLEETYAHALGMDLA